MCIRDRTMGMLAVRIKEGLGLDAVRVTGNLSRKVKKVALCTGAGDVYKRQDQMEEEFVRLIKNGEHKDTVVCDYIACMTDRDVYKRQP